MKILVVSNAFPPFNAISSLRPYSWAKYWSRLGHEVTVLTTFKENKSCDLNVDLSFCRVVEINYMVHYPLLSRRIVPTESLKESLVSDVRNKKKGNSIFRKLVKILLKNSGILFSDSRLPNIYQLWVKEAIKTITNEKIKYDVVIATYAPFATFQIANKLKKIGLAKKIVFDYRDLWTDSPFKGLILFRSYEKYLEKKLVKSADILTIVSEPLARKQSKKFNREVFSVLNGYDLEDDKKQIHGNFFDRNKINILYTGSIYEGFRDPSPLFAAVEELKRDNYVNLSKLLITYIGNSGSEIDSLLNNFEINEYVENKGFCSREVALAMQKHANILLFLDHNGDNGDGFLTGKLFEYLFSGTFIWSLGGKYSASQIIEENNVGKFLGNDIILIKKNLKEIIENGIPNISRQESILKFKTYTREFQAQNMLKLFS